MTEQTCTAEDCGKPAHAGYLCAEHTGRLARDLMSIAELWPELDVTLSRQSVTTRQGEKAGGKSAGGSLPFDLGASEAKWEIENTVLTWLRDSAGDRLPEIDQPWAGVPFKVPPPILINTVVLACQWMRTYLSALVLQPQAPQFADEIRYACGLLVRAIGAPTAPTYIGRCECGADVWAKAHRVYQVCEGGCGTVHDLDALRIASTQAARETFAPASDIVAGARMFGVEISHQRISEWYADDRVRARRDDEKPRHYLVGDVIRCAEIARDTRARTA